MNHYDVLLRRCALQDSGGLAYLTWDSGGLRLLAERDAAGNVTAEYAHGHSAVPGIGTCVAAGLLAGDRTLLGLVAEGGWAELLGEEDVEAEERLRRVTRTGRPAGDRRFVRKVERLTGRELRPGRPGRPAANRKRRN